MTYGKCFVLNSRGQKFPSYPKKMRLTCSPGCCSTFLKVIRVAALHLVIESYVCPSLSRCWAITSKRAENFIWEDDPTLQGSPLLSDHPIAASETRRPQGLVQASLPVRASIEQSRNDRLYLCKMSWGMQGLTVELFGVGGETCHSKSSSIYTDWQWCNETTVPDGKSAVNNWCNIPPKKSLLIPSRATECNMLREADVARGVTPAGGVLVDPAWGYGSLDHSWEPWVAS